MDPLGIRRSRPVMVEDSHALAIRLRPQNRLQTREPFYQSNGKRNLTK
jgi:hypothetical protein